MPRYDNARTREETEMQEPRCAVPVPHVAAKEFKERRKEIEALLRGHDPEEGHDWPEPDRREGEAAERG